MKPDDTYEAPFQTDDEETNNRIQSDLPEPEDAAEVNCGQRSLGGDGGSIQR